MRVRYFSIDQRDWGKADRARGLGRHRKKVESEDAKRNAAIIQVHALDVEHHASVMDIDASIEVAPNFLPPGGAYLNTTANPCVSCPRPKRTLNSASRRC